MRYVDFDGVILDTAELLFEEWLKSPDRPAGESVEKLNYIKNANWKFILENSQIINDSINILKCSSIYEYAILTRIHSLENEGTEKIKFLRKFGVKQNIILAPYYLSKSEVVVPNGNVLIDDSINNLEDWYKNGGYPMFFDYKHNNIDPWGLYNSEGFQRVYKINEQKLS